MVSQSHHDLKFYSHELRLVWPIILRLENNVSPAHMTRKYCWVKTLLQIKH